MGLLRLSVDGKTLDLKDSTATGLFVTGVDLGAPAVRVDVRNLPTQDGAIDRTTFLAQRVVSITGVAVGGVNGSRSVALAALRPFLAPGARPILTFTLDDESEVLAKNITLRVAQWTEPMRQPWSSEFMVSWAADPVALGDVVHKVEVAPFFSGGGRSYDLSFNRTYPAGGSTGLITASVDGTYPPWPTYRLFGPITDPVIAIINPLTAAVLGQVAFAGIVVAQGDYLDIDTQARTVLLNGDPGANRYSFVDFPNTTWRQLQLGSNTLRYSGEAPAVPALAQIRWRDTYL